MRVKNWMVITAAGLIILFVLACAGGADGGPKTYKIKEDIKVGKATWKVLNVERGMEFPKSDGSGKLKAEGTFVLIELTINNGYSEPNNLTGQELELVDEAKNTFSFDSKSNNMTLAGLGRDSLIGQGMLAAGQTMQGWILFDVNKDAKGLMLRTKDIDIRSRESAMVDLGL